MQGNQSDPSSEAVDIGAFRAEPGKGRFDRGDILAAGKRPLRPGEQRMTIITPSRPAYIGVDPYNLLIGRSPARQCRCRRRRICNCAELISFIKPA